MKEYQSIIGKVIIANKTYRPDVQWGVYTLRQNDARTLAYKLSPVVYNAEAVTMHYPAHDIGEYPHFHPAGHSYKGENIHCWFGNRRLR